MVGNLFGSEEMGLVMTSHHQTLSIILDKNKECAPYYGIILNDDDLDGIKNFLEQAKWQK